MLSGAKCEAQSCGGTEIYPVKHPIVEMINPSQYLGSAKVTTGLYNNNHLILRDIMINASSSLKSSL